MAPSKIDPEALALNRIVRILEPMDRQIRARVCELLHSRYASVLARLGEPREGEIRLPPPWMAPWEAPKAPPSEPLACPHGHLIDEPCHECGQTNGSPQLIGREVRP